MTKEQDVTEEEKMLESFGRSVIERVRDDVIGLYARRSPDSYLGSKEDEFRFLSGLDENDSSRANALIRRVVDQTIHYFLYMLSETEGLKVTMTSEKEETLDLLEFTNGRMGGMHYEMHDVDGWVQKFSKFPRTGP